MQGSAYLLPFYQGVVQALTDAGALKDTTRLAGLSGGTLTSALLAAGVSGEAQFRAVTDMIKDCSAAGPAGCQPLNEKLGTLLAGLWPPEGAGRLVGDRVRVWVSALPDVGSPGLTGSVPYGLTNFTSTADVEAALFGSDMIPCFSDARTFNLVRGVPAMDGGFSSDFRELCSDAVAAGRPCVTAATAVVSPAGMKDADGASLEGCPAAVGGGYATGPARQGAKGAAPLAAPTAPQSEWALPTSCPANGDPATIWPPFVAQGSTLPEGTKPDIYPGARTAALKAWEACEWLSYALKPDFARWQDVYDAGLAEGAAWAAAEGWCVEKEIAAAAAAGETSTQGVEKVEKRKGGAMRSE